MTSKSLIKWLRFSSAVILIVLAIWLINKVGITQLRAQVDHLGVWAPAAVSLLRFTSIVIPALPGTAYALLAGGLFGFPKGLAVIAVSDLISCSLSFYIARRYGQGMVKRFVGDRFMSRVNAISERHLESNFFLMTAFLMTSFFDFVSYGIGLTKTPARKFFPALLLSIAISDPPIVALGAGGLEGGKILLVFGLLGMFGLALITGLVKHQSRQHSKHQPEDSRE
ncbi:MAG: TVP38/TMEM64 family protein [Leptolyngbyaceae cyanobacterium]